MNLQAGKIINAFKRLMPFLLIILIGWNIGDSISRGRIFILLIYGFLFLFLLVSTIRIRVLYLLVPLFFLSGYTIYLFDLPSQLMYLTDALMLFLIATSFLQAFIQKKITIPRFMLVVWILYMLFVFVINSSFTIIAFQSLTAYLIFPLFFIAIINSRMSEKIERKVLTLIIIFIAIQLPITIIQKIIYYNVSPDRVGGTLGRAGTPFMGVLMSGAWSFILAYIIIYRKKSIMSFLLLILPFVPLMLGESKGGFILTACAGVTVYLAYTLLSKVRFRDIGWSILIIFPIGTGYIVYKYFPILINPDNAVGSFVLRVFSSWDNILKYLSGYHFGGTGPAHRLEVIYFISTYLSGVYEKLFGLGIGLVSSSALLGITTFQDVELTNILGWITSFGKYYIETGILGVSLFLLVLISLALKGAKLMRSSNDRRWKTLYLGFVGSTGVFIAGSFYTNPWQHDALAGSFWICAAIMTRVWLRHKQMHSVKSNSY